MKAVTKPEFKLLPCIFCTLGFNCYVAGYKVVSASYQKITHKPNMNVEQVKPVQD